MTLRTIDGPSLKRALESGDVTVIDVREPAEFAGGHVPGALNIPLARLSAHDFGGIAGKPVVLVCASGRRSAMGCEALHARPDLAAIDVRTLEGGTPAYVAAGGTLARTGRGVMPIERQVFAIAGLLVLTGVSLGVLVHPGFHALAAFVGAGLMVSGLTGFCGMALLLARAPWNQARPAAA